MGMVLGEVPELAHMVTFGDRLAAAVAYQDAMATANANLASELIGNKEVAALIAAAITLKKSKAQAAAIDKEKNKPGKIDDKAAAEVGKDLPYNSKTIRESLKEKHGNKNVTSTTVPPDNAPNVKLAGKNHPETKVPFDLKGYPIFDNVAAFDTRLPNYKSLSYKQQMQAASKDLWAAIQRGEVPASKFTTEQLKQIKAGSAKINKYTWHHHQDAGRMQLVPTEYHRKTGHIGNAMSEGK